MPSVIAISHISDPSNTDLEPQDGLGVGFDADEDRLLGASGYVTSTVLRQYKLKFAENFAEEAIPKLSPFQIRAPGEETMSWWQQRYVSSHLDFRAGF